MSEIAEEWNSITEGRIIHIKQPGITHCQPAIVVRHWGNGVVNLIVFQDGVNDSGLNTPLVIWKTSVPHESDTSHVLVKWHWPERE